MAIRSIEIAPLGYARLGGAFYLAISLFGAFEESFITNKLIAGGDAAATAHSILASSRLWQIGIAGNVPVVSCAISLLWIECLLPRPASKSLLLALLSNPIFLAVEAASKVFCWCCCPRWKCPVPAGLWSSTGVDAGESYAEVSRDFLQYCAVVFWRHLLGEWIFDF